MPALRRRLKDPRFWLFFFAVIFGLALNDSFRPPSHQLTGKFYCYLVEEYQHFGRPLLKGRVQCRFVPTCSVYSIEAVRAFGIRRGLVLTIDRLSRCRGDVPLGTRDPIPKE